MWLDGSAEKKNILDNHGEIEKNANVQCDKFYPPSPYYRLAVLRRARYDHLSC